jgi:hypothetical protein
VIIDKTSLNITFPPLVFASCLEIFTRPYGSGG